MPFKLVNKYGQNFAHRTFKTQAAARAYKKYLQCTTGSKMHGAKIEKTKKIRR